MFAAQANQPDRGAGQGTARSWEQPPAPAERPAAPDYRASSPLPADGRGSSAPSSDASVLNQLLRALEQSDSAARPGASPLPAQLPSSPPAQPPGAFTGIYGVREQGGSQADRLPASTPAPAPDAFIFGDFAQRPPVEPAGGGVSEFTRIVQASSLREQALQRGEQAAAAAAPAQQAATPAAGPARLPAFPSTSVLPPVQFGASIPQPTPPVAGMPSLTPPPWTPPQAPQPPAAPAPPANKAQQILPIVLIGVICVLVIALVAVIFTMKR